MQTCSSWAWTKWTVRLGCLCKQARATRTLAGNAMAWSVFTGHTWLITENGLCPSSSFSSLCCDCGLDRASTGFASCCSFSRTGPACSAKSVKTPTQSQRAATALARWGKRRRPPQCSSRMRRTARRPEQIGGASAKKSSPVGHLFIQQSLRRTLRSQANDGAS